MPKEQEKKIGNYEIVGELGRGGMGVVYRAIQPSLNREVALKVLPPYFAKDKELVERFFREARAAAKLKHPHIVTVYDFGEDEETYYFAMELLEGESLESLIKGKGTFSLSEIEAIITQVADALGYAHKRQIVHRDIKPGNIIINERGDAVLTDFGIAKAASDSKLTQTGTSVGSPEFMSPEQVQGGEVDFRSDLYSLGILIYKLMTGTAPYKGETGISIAFKHVNEPVPSLKSALPGVPDWMDAVVSRLLAKDPADRYQSAEELIKALREKKAPPEAAAAPAAAPVPKSAPKPARLSPKAPKIKSRPAAPKVKPPKTGAAGPGFLDRIRSLVKGLPESRRRLVLVVGAAACLLAIVLIVVLIQSGGGRAPLRAGGGALSSEGAGEEGALDYQSLYIQARDFYEQGDYDKALERAEAARTQQDSPEIQTLIRNIESEKKGVENADELGVLISEAMAYYVNGDYVEAQETLVKAKRLANTAQVRDLEAKINAKLGVKKQVTSRKTAPTGKKREAGSTTEAAPDLPPVRLTRAPDIVKDSQPVYPNLAKRQGEEGTVVLEVTIDVEGRVVETKILRGSTMFNNAASKAVQQRRYKPVVVKGVRRAAVFNTAILFRLEK
jgi:TonB family protein